MSDGAGSNDSIDANVPVDRARMIAAVQPSGGTLKNVISRISTEYRLQFAWPKGCKERDEDKGTGPPRKSLSMGAIKPAAIMPLNSAIAAVHKKRITDADRKFGAELEPLVGWNSDCQEDGFEGGEEKIQEESLGKDDKAQTRLSRAGFNSEYKKKFRPFSQYDYVEGKFKAKKEPEPLLVHELAHGDSWYREVLELRKKAGEYKHRGWGTELVPQHIAELYNKQMTLWEQVSRRSSLSALSLASTTPRSITKEEKEKENNKKSSPTKPPRSRDSPSRHASPQKRIEKVDDNKKESLKPRKETGVRHHLDRTTGAVDGALLHSPTREKLEPVIPRRKEDSSEQVTKSGQKATSARSQSVGPNTTYSSENRSPKRSAKTSSKVVANGPVPLEKHTRPTTLTTTAPPRTKSNSGMRRTTPKGKAGKVTPQSKEETPLDIDTVDAEAVADPQETSEVEPAINVEPVIKSPPEPTRVKSPEQILMRSPEPVNWTVPLDTGKVFTVTQNVHEGDLIQRPQSEAKAWTPPAAPPTAPQSAPPQLPEPEGLKSPESHPEDILNGTTDSDTLKFKRPNEIGERQPHSSSVLTTAESPTVGISSVTDAVDMARSRFEKFWGGKKESLEKEGIV